MERKKRQQYPKRRSEWVPPRLTRIGDLEEIVRGGGGKLSQAGADPGDVRKPKGSG